MFSLSRIHGAIEERYQNWTIACIGTRTHRRTINLLEHLPHSLDVIMVEEPCFWVLFVFFEWYRKRIGNIHAFAIILP